MPDVHLPLAAAPAVAHLVNRLEEAEQWVRSGRVVDGLKLARDSWPEVEQTTSLALQGNCQRIIGIAHQYAGHDKDALLACYQALDLFEQAALSADTARVLSIAAISLAHIGDSAGALELLTRAQALASTVDEPGTAFRVLVNLSVVYESMADHRNAIRASESALEMARTLGDPHMIAHVQTNLCGYRVEHGLSLQLAGDPDEAARQLRQARDEIEALLPVCRAADLDHMVASLLAGLGAVFGAIGDPGAARTALDEGLAITQADGLLRDQSMILLSLGKIEHLAGRQDVAMAHLHMALRLAEEVAEPDLIARCQLELSRTLEAQGDFFAALQFFRRYHDTHIGVLREQAAARAQVLSIQLDNERTRLENEVLRFKADELERNNRDLTSQAERLARHANEDPLTGLGNRRAFEQHMNALRASGLGSAPKPVMFAVIDIDHFKRVNDRFSHAVGDLVLQQLAALLRECCRPHDVVARFGGEEFVIGLIGASAAHAEAVAERLRIRVEDHAWSAIQAGLAITISIGLACGTAGAEPAHALAAADDALYEAKRMGRNRVCTAS